LDSPIEKIGLHCPVNMKWFLNTSKKIRFLFASKGCHGSALESVGAPEEVASNGWLVESPFMEVLQNLEKTNSNFRFIATMTGMARSKKTWKGETGLINQEMLSKYLNDLRGPIYYIRRASRHGQWD
jgi:hypothetical protein